MNEQLIADRSQRALGTRRVSWPASVAEFMRIRTARNSHEFSYRDARAHYPTRSLRRRALTLAEVVVSSVSAMTLLAGLTSALFVVSRSASTKQSTNLTTAAGFALDEMAAELRTAKSIKSRSATAVTFTVADRSNDADSNDETITYAWDKNIGGTITRTYNGVSAPFLRDVYNLSFGYNTQSLTGNKRVLFVQGNVTGTEATYDNFRVTTMQGWGYTVIRTTTTASTSQVELEAAAACSDVVYVSSTVPPNDLNTKLKNSAKGIVLEEALVADSFGLTTTDGPQAIEDQIRISDNSHYITSGLSTGAVRILTSASNLRTIAPNYASGLVWYGTEKNDPRYPNIAIMEAGGLLVDGTQAAGVRVFVPWGGDNLNPAQLNSDGQGLWRRTLDWATGNQTYTSIDISLQITGDDNQTGGSSKKIEPTPGVVLQTRAELLGKPRI